MERVLWRNKIKGGHLALGEGESIREEGRARPGSQRADRGGETGNEDQDEGYCLQEGEV